MPGYYVHLAACNKEARKNRSFVCGVEVPDLLKKYYQLYGLEGTKVRYNLIKTPEMPEFKVLSPRVQQLENYLGQDGMHYGWSSSPDYRCFLNNLSHDDKNNPFYRGYLYHLLTDLLMYSYLDIESKFADFKMKHKNDENLLTLLNKEYDKLHND